jgi:hypothetical protein
LLGVARNFMEPTWRQCDGGDHLWGLLVSVLVMMLWVGWLVKCFVNGGQGGRCGHLGQGKGPPQTVIAI